MKKYIYILAAVFAVILSSCSNDDIPVGRAVTFKLNPATVVNNLYEKSAGDLSSLTKGSVLNIALYVYDESGRLAAHDSQEFSAYTQLMTSNLTLDIGAYTAVAISYVSSSVEYWDFAGMENLSTLKITDNGYIGGKSKMLGLSVKKMYVDENSDTFNINIENGGAVGCVWIRDWNRYSDVKEFGLIGKQTCDYITTDLGGNVEYSLDRASDYAWYLAKMGYDPNYIGMYTYFFTFPIQNAAMRFFAHATDGTRVFLGPNLVDDIRLGDSYLMIYDVTDDETFWMDMTPSRAGGNTSDMLEKDEDDAPHAVYNYEEASITIE